MQAALFDTTEAPASLPGLAHEDEFLGRAEEAALLAVIATLPLAPARYKDHLARRRIVSYGGSYDFDGNSLQPGEALDERLHPLRRRVAAWVGVDEAELVHALVAAYAPGTPLGWHRDVPDFEMIAGVSLGAPAVIRFRPYPPDAAAQRHAVDFLAAPRSIYRLSGPARWDWQHCVPPVTDHRWSITFRTFSRRRPRAGSRRVPTP